jgi:hypothetical protein
VIIDSRFNGPPDSGNGGVTCGLLATAVDLVQPEVTLRVPPPLGRELQLEDNSLYDGDQLVAEAHEGTVDIEAPPSVTVAQARAASDGYDGITGHPFPTCFVCGPDHPTGLLLMPGPVAPGVVATDWVPESADPVLVWAALDCPGAWAACIQERPMVLGRLACRIDALPEPGRAHVVQGWARGDEGRKVFTGTALYDDTGRVLAVAKATWITITL